MQTPEGQHTYVADYARGVSGGWHTLPGVSASAHFIAGRTYRMLADEGAEIATSGNGLTRMAQMSQNMYGNKLQIRIVEVTP